MTVKSKLPYDKAYVEQFSNNLNEPEWMTSIRLQAFEQAQALDLPKPDKTNITRWNFSEFKHHAQGEVIPSIDALPETLQGHLDEENVSDNLIIQRNQTVAYATLRDRKSTRLNSSHVVISYSFFCLIITYIMM